MILVLVIWIAIAVLMGPAYCFVAWIGEAKAYERYIAEREDRDAP